MNFIPVRTTTLNCDFDLTFDVYLKLPHKYVLYVKKGNGVDHTSMERIRSKKVRKLYIEDKDEELYQKFLDYCLENSLSDQTAGLEQKARSAHNVAVVTGDKLYEEPGAQSAYQGAIKLSNNLFKLLSDNDQALGEFLKSSNAQNGAQLSKKEVIKKHALRSCSLAIRFGEFLGLDRKQLETLGVAALYHDIGFKELSETAQECFFLKDIMSHQGFGPYKEHPQVAATILQDKSFVGPEVMDLILTHEERLSDKGFPRKSQKLSLIQEAHALVCHYDRLVTCVELPAQETLSELLVQEVGNFNLETLKKFKTFMSKIAF